MIDSLSAPQPLPHCAHTGNSCHLRPCSRLNSGAKAAGVLSAAVPVHVGRDTCVPYGNRWAWRCVLPRVRASQVRCVVNWRLCPFDAHAGVGATTGAQGAMINQCRGNAWVTVLGGRRVSERAQ